MKGLKKFVLVFLFLLFKTPIFAQTNDSVFHNGQQVITLSNIVVDNKLNVPSFIQRIKNDSSFYKAFRTLHITGYTVLNDIRILDKKDNINASLNSKTKQIVKNGCRFMETLNQNVQGDFFTNDGQYNYYTASMYASLFFTKDTICGENNIVAGRQFSTAGKRGMDKHKEQLKILFFNPGKKITGIPFISNKTAIYDEDMADNYEMKIDMDVYNKTNCYIFYQKVKKGKEDKVVMDEMTTWFNVENMEVVARNYKLKYDAAVYDFDVSMEVQMTTFNGQTIPYLIRYVGNWKAITKKRERAVFTATLFDFE